MSIKWMSRVWDESPYRNTMLLIHIAMADYANDEGEFWAKQTSLAKKAHVSPEYVSRVVKQMVEDGLLRKYRRGRRLAYQLLTLDQRSSLKHDERSSLKHDERSSRNMTNDQVHIEPSVEPSEKNRQKNVARGATEETEMPDDRLTGGEPDLDDKPSKPKRKQTTGTNRCVTYFENQIKVRYRIDYFSVGLVKREVAALLRERRLTPEEVMDYMDYWLLREDADIRKARSVADRGPIDLGAWFRKGLSRGMLDVWDRERTKAFTAVNKVPSANEMLDRFLEAKK